MKGSIILKFLLLLNAVGATLGLLAAVAFVGSGTCTGTKKTCTITYQPDGHSLELIDFVDDTGAPNLLSVTQTNITNSWLNRCSLSIGTTSLTGLWLSRSGTATTLGGTITINLAKSSNSAAMVTEISGVEETSLDGSLFRAEAVAASGTSSTPATNSLNMANGIYAAQRGVFLAFVGYALGSSPTVQPSGYNSINFVAAPATNSIQGNYRIVSANETSTPSWTLASSANWAACIIDVVELPKLLPMLRAAAVLFWPDLWFKGLPPPRQEL